MKDLINQNDAIQGVTLGARRLTLVISNVLQTISFSYKKKSNFFLLKPNQNFNHGAIE